MKAGTFESPFLLIDEMTTEQLVYILFSKAITDLYSSFYTVYYLYMQDK